MSPVCVKQASPDAAVVAAARAEALAAALAATKSGLLQQLHGRLAHLCGTLQRCAAGINAMRENNTLETAVSSTCHWC